MLQTIPNIAEISMDYSSVLQIKFLPKANITEEIAEKVVSMASRVAGKRRHCNLVDTRDMLYMDDKARKVFAEQNKTLVLGVGVIINSRFQKSLANLYLKFSKPAIPTKMFDDIDAALLWLKSLS